VPRCDFSVGCRKSWIDHRLDRRRLVELLLLPVACGATAQSQRADPAGLFLAPLRRQQPSAAIFFSALYSWCLHHLLRLGFVVAAVRGLFESTFRHGIPARRSGSGGGGTILICNSSVAFWRELTDTVQATLMHLCVPDYAAIRDFALAT